MIDLAQYYQNKAAEFVKTVVCFDDKAEYLNDITQAGKEALALVASDGFESSTAPTEQAPPQPKTEYYESSLDAVGKGESDELDARVLTEEFARNGILCSVIVPRSTPHEIKTQILALTKTADIAILDWKLAPNDSTIARDAIVDILKSDVDCGGRLRLIAIYSDGDAKNIMAELEECLKDVGFTLHEETSVLKGDHALIVFFQKPNTPKPTAEVIQYTDLPQRTIGEFSKLTSGLLPAAALTAITEIREQTHHLLATFPATLDGAFLAHRCLIPDPNDSELFLLDLLEGEIGSILHKGAVKEAVNLTNCSAWVASKNSMSSEEHAAVLKSLEKYKRSNKLQIFKKVWQAEKEHEIAEKVIELFYKSNPADLPRAKKELSIITTLDSYGKQTKAPRLRLGVVVQDHSRSKFFLCIQPLCDSLRIKADEAREFPFLELENYSFGTDQSSLEFCIPHNGETFWFSVKTSPKNLATYPFTAKSATEGFIEAVPEEGSHFFTSVNGVKLEWLAELKIGKAQRIASQLAARLHTLGIDEFEWLRLHQRQNH